MTEREAIVNADWLSRRPLIRHWRKRETRHSILREARSIFDMCIRGQWSLSLRYYAVILTTRQASSFSGSLTKHIV